MTTSRRRRLPPWMVGTSAIALSMGVMNVATYAFTLVTARVLGPREYGALAAVMGLALVLNVVALGLQATAARAVSVAARDERPSHAEEPVLRASYQVATGLFLASLLATPLVVSFLRLDSWEPAALLALTLWPLTVMGGQAGLLQGEQRWPELAGVYVAMGLGRLVLGLAAVAWRPDVTGAMVGVAAGAFVPALLGHRLVARRRRTRADAPEPGRRVLRDIFHDSHALLAFFTLSTADVILARNVLDDHRAGLYAGGLILTKAVLFLPQFVVVLAFPAMARAAGGRQAQRLALLCVALIGGLATTAAFLLPEVAVLFVGGDSYDEVAGRIWAFAGIGTLAALLQLLVYGTLAREHRHAVWVLWGGVTALVLVGLTVVDTVDGLLTSVALIDVAVLTVLLVLGPRVTRPVPPAPVVG